MSLWKFYTFTLTCYANQINRSHRLLQYQGRRFIVHANSYFKLDVVNQQRADNLARHISPEIYFKRLQTRRTTFVNTQELRIAVCLAHSDDHWKITNSLLKRYLAKVTPTTSINADMIFKHLYVLKKPDLMCEMYMDRDLQGFYHLRSCRDLALCALYDAGGRYEDVVRTYLTMAHRLPLRGVMSAAATALALASCLVMNTPESYQQALEIMRKIKEQEFPLKRGLYCAALLAHKQNDPTECLNMIADAPLTNQTASLKILSFVRLGKLKESVHVIDIVLGRRASEIPILPDRLFLYEEVLAKLNEAVDTCNDKLLQSTFALTYRAMQQENRIIDREFEAHILQPKQAYRKAQEDIQIQRQS